MLTMEEARSAESAERAIRASEGMAEAVRKLASEVAWQGGFAEDFAADSLWQFCAELLADYCEPDEGDDGGCCEPEGRTALAVGVMR